MCHPVEVRTPVDFFLFWYLKMEKYVVPYILWFSCLALNFPEWNNSIWQYNTFDFITFVLFMWILITKYKIKLNILARVSFCLRRNHWIVVRKFSDVFFSCGDCSPTCVFSTFNWVVLHSGLAKDFSTCL